MRQVPVRELNQHTAEVLARVERGERVEITRNGIRVAILEPVEPDAVGLLMESGELRPARGPLVLHPPSELAEEEASAGLDAVLEDRYGQDRW